MTITPGTIRTGLWCARCALPAAWSVVLYAVGIDGVSAMGTMVGCTSHDGTSDG